jgi:deoxycytidylate deaminase
MRLALAAIKRERQLLITNPHDLDRADDSEKSVEFEVSNTETQVWKELFLDSEVAFRSAFIIRQIKRPQEVHFLRSIYGEAFILISAYGSEADRKRKLEELIRSTVASPIAEARASFLASKLIASDMEENRDEHGQHLRDAYHKADVIIDGISPQLIGKDLRRFISALFGSNEIGPTRAEHGMNGAYAASLRSSDLSRQVGAMIFSQEGEVISQGCNEVPKAFGGTYWDQEEPDYRDIRLGKDSNDILKFDVLKDLFDRLRRSGLLSSKLVKAKSPAEIVDHLVGRKSIEGVDPKLKGILKTASIMDLTEYGRVVHAEMSAVTDAARTGRPLKLATLYCTTFPCHNCTKHILSAGIKKVVFLEPYPKSKAKDLHAHEISIESEEEGKVSFLPFIGIAPRRYELIFKKGKRKRDGRAVRWMYGGPAPMIDLASPAYLRLEELAMYPSAVAGEIENSVEEFADPSKD